MYEEFFSCSFIFVFEQNIKLTEYDFNVDIMCDVIP